MRKVCTKILSIVGNVLTVRAEGIAYEELAEVSTAMGKSLAAVAHDIKAPLAVIGGFAELSLAIPRLVCNVDILPVFVDISLVLVAIFPVLVSTAKLSRVANTGGFADGSLGIPRLAVLPILA